MPPTHFMGNPPLVERKGRHLPPQDPHIEKIVTRALKDIFFVQRFNYDKNPPHNWTFSDLLRKNPFSHDFIAEAGRLQPKKIFAYRLNSMRSDDDSLIPIARHHFWHLLRPLSSLLLSDGITQHYTTVYCIQDEEETIDLIDPWPEKIFLKDGLNTRHIRARIIEMPDQGKLVRISRAELEKVIVGAVTLESAAFHAHLFDTVPGGKDDPLFLHALSVSNLGRQISTEDPLTALNYAIMAFELLPGVPDEKQQLNIVRQLLYAYEFTTYWLIASRPDPEIRKEAVQALATTEIQLLNQQAPLSMEDLSTDQIHRLAQMAYNAHDPYQSEIYFSWLIERRPDDPRGYFGRAKLRNRTLDHAGVIADSTACLNLMEHIRDENEMAWDGRDQDAYALLDWLSSGPGQQILNYMWCESFSLRATAHVALRHYHEAEMDGRAAILNAPDNYQNYLTVAMALNESRRQARALLFYRKGMALAPHQELQQRLLQLIQKLTFTVKQSEPDLDSGTTVQATFLFRHVDGFNAFTKAAENDQPFIPDADHVIGVLPKGTMVLMRQKPDAAYAEIRTDTALIDNVRWSQDALENDFRDGIVKGLVLSFHVSPV